MSTALSIPGVVEVTEVVGLHAGAGPSRLVIEVPHGATHTAEFRALEARLQGPFPPGLADFFHVNTDAGAPELARAVASSFVALVPGAVVTLIRSELPRTFVDPNRVLDASPELYREGRVTPGMPPYVRAEGDKALLRALHSAYVGVARAAVDEVCGSGGAALLLHTYAPRSVDVEVDDDIGPALRAAYQPEVYPRWPLRPALDLICRTPDGMSTVSGARVEALRAALSTLGQALAEGETYPLHPSTQAFGHVERHPGRVACLEVRRDLLADPFEPFAQMTISPAKVAPLAAALAGWLADDLRRA